MATVPSIVTLLLFAAGGIGHVAPDTLLTELQVLGSFDQAHRLVLDPQGVIYVADIGRQEIIALRDDQSAPRTVGGLGWDAGAFDRPSGLATDGLNLFVADNGNHRIQRFDRSLNFISSFVTRDSSAVAPRFGYPVGVALSRLGDLFVLDGENLRVMKFSAAMRYERAFGDFDDRRARLSNPLKILVGGNDRVYVLEPDRLLEFDYFGHYVRTIGEGVFREARSFSLSDHGFIVVAGAVISWFTERGEFQRSIPATDLIVSSPLSSLADVVARGDRLYLLTSHHLHVFRISAVGD